MKISDKTIEKIAVNLNYYMKCYSHKKRKITTRVVCFYENSAY
jgi:hypothetical protein